LNPASRNRLKSFKYFIEAIADCKGHVPRIGDDDEGRVIWGERQSHEYLASICSAIALLSSRPPSIPKKTSLPSLRASIFSIPTDNLKAELAVPNRCVFPCGGYTVLRELAYGRECLLVFDHGPLGYLGIAAHGHADAMSIWLHVDGQVICGDAGTYLYHSGGHWRSYFRGTAAHSTLTINGKDQSTQAGLFNWSSKAASHVVSGPIDAGEDFRVIAEHDGYHKRFGVTHRRMIVRLLPGMFQIEDELLGRPQHIKIVEVGYLIPAGLNVISEEAGWLIEAGSFALRIRCADAADYYIQRGVEKPELRGWCSPAFSQKTPCSRLVARVRKDTLRLTSVLSLHVT
jgi:hypothetical protein